MKQAIAKFLFFQTALIMIASLPAAAETASDKIARAKSAAPPSISAKATVQDVDGTLLEKGSNGWVCQPGIAPGDNHPMCNDDVWMKLMKAAAGKEDFTPDRVGISYMLQGDAKVSNSDPYATDQDNGDVWIQEGPHMMVIVPKDMLNGISDDPHNGGPYVMWKNTPYAHIMVPLGKSM